MGNQSTSGIVAEAKAANEAPEKAQEVSSPDDLTEKNQTLIQKDETKDCQEKAGAQDSHDVEADRNPPVEKLKSDEKVSEEHKGSVNGDCETQGETGLNESNLEEERPKFNNEGQDQPCTLKGDMQNPNPKCTSAITNLNSTPHESVGITAELQEHQSMLREEIVETQGLANSSQIESESSLVDAVEKNEDDLVVADIDSVEGAVLENCACKEELGRNNDPPQEGQSNSFNTPNDLPSNSLVNLSAAENEKQTECLALGEEKPMMNELGNGDVRSYVDQTQIPDQEIDQFLISCSNHPPELIKSEFRGNGYEHGVENDSVSGLEKVDLLDGVKAGDEMEGFIAVAENQEDKEPIGKSIAENVALRESEPSAIENDHDSERGTTGNCLSESQSSEKIERVAKFEPLCSATAEAESPLSLAESQYIDSETFLFEDSESKANGSREMLDSESNASCTGGQVELRKSPSFDFGLSFDTRSEESDQTPLLYQDRTAMRSFSSCSNLRFQNRSVQTEYSGKYEAVEVEEKTIRMERSNSESLRVPPLNLLIKDKNADVVTKTKQENSASDKKQEIGFKASPSRDDGATVSPKGNGKRKPRSSLFTTCMCCTAAIS